MKKFVKLQNHSTNRAIKKINWNKDKIKRSYNKVLRKK